WSLVMVTDAEVGVTACAALGDHPPAATAIAAAPTMLNIFPPFTFPLPPSERSGDHRAGDGCLNPPCSRSPGCRRISCIGRSVGALEHGRLPVCVAVLAAVGRRALRLIDCACDPADWSDGV